MTEHPVASDDPVVLPTSTGRVLLLRTMLASLWLAACLLNLVRLATEGAALGVLLSVLLAGPAVLVLLAAVRSRRPTVVERVGDDLVITASAFLTSPLRLPVGDVVEVRWGVVQPPGGSPKEWPVLSCGGEADLSLHLGRPVVLPPHPVPAWTGETVPVRDRPTTALLLPAADPERDARAIARLVGLDLVHLPPRR